MRPAQRPGASKQDYGTPPEFLRAVEARFGAITHDLAARADNRVAPGFFGPEQDSIVQDWTALTGTLWLNPPFGRVAPWAAKCQRSKGPNRRIVMLTPAAVGTEWFAESVYGHARVYALRPRITFVGTRDPYPSDLMLSVYCTELPPALCLWRWYR